MRTVPVVWVALGLLVPVGHARAGDPFVDWTSHRNRLLPDPPPIVRQDFGYSLTRYTGTAAPGEIGGFVQRSAVPAWYALPIPPKTFADRLTARGRFSARKVSGASGTLVGWFNSKTTAGWRSRDTLNFRVDGNGDKFWVFFEYGTSALRTGGIGCFEGEEYQRTRTKPFPGDGTPHDWELTYDPAGNDGGGLVTFTLDGQVHRLPLAAGHKADGATFDRFGIFNQQISGKGMELHVGGLSIDGKPIDLSADPKWEGSGNRGTYATRYARPRHDFGAAGGRAGGVIWRHPEPAYFAVPTGRLTLDDALEASGTIVLKSAASDSGATFGWFDTESLLRPTAAGKPPILANRLGLMIEGPSRDGHYFRPEYATAAGDRVIKPDGPAIFPDGQPRRWSFKYDPTGPGRITYRLDAVEQTLDLKPEHRKAGATFDRFGLYVRERVDGNCAELYLSELKFTTKPGRK